MEKVKNYFWKTIDFIYKHKVISFFIAFGIATSFILFNVFADEDQYKNALAVSEASITAIADGSDQMKPFDSEEGAGKDSSDGNGILRNFDNITYNISYKLGLKEGTTTDVISDRIVIIDVIVPKIYSASLSSPEINGEGTERANSLDANYNYYEFAIDGISITQNNPNTLSFTLRNLITKTPDSELTPIILMKESTDERYKAISEMTTEEKEGFINNITENTVSCNSNNIHCTTRMTGTYDNVEVKLYPGTYDGGSTDTITDKNFPIGVRVSCSSVGTYIPSSISFDLGTTFDTSLLNVSYVDNSLVNYKDPNKNYSVYISNWGELPNIQNTVSYENGVVTISNLSDSRGTVGTASFEINSKRVSTAVESNSDIVLKPVNIRVGETVIHEAGEEITITDYYKKFVGSFTSLFEIKNADHLNTSSSAIFINYNEGFEINEKLLYARDGVGDDLSELNNYIKIDSDAFIISKEDNTIEENTSGSSGVLRYAHGHWTSDYFELTGVEGCPTNISSLTKENLMNLYGGPCLREKETVKWNDDETDLPIIIVNALFGDKDSDELNVNEGLEATIKITGKVKKDFNLVYTSHQMSVMSTGVFNNELYYLSKTPDYSDVANAKNKDNYQKQVYNFDTEIMENDIYPCNDGSISSTVCDCHIGGQTVHINAYQGNNVKIKSYYNDIERNTFYDYPIEWRINSDVTYNDDSIVFDKAAIEVFVPAELNYLYAETMENDVRKPKEYVNVSSADGQFIPGYKIYTFEFSEDEISNGAINTLSVFTDVYLSTKTGSNPALFASSSFDGYKIVDSNVVRLKDASLFGTMSSKDVTINNGSDITTSGSVSSTYIEKSKPYTYTMKAYNNSSNGTNSGYAYTNATMYYMLPYIEDSNYKTYEKKFTNSSYKVKLTENPAGYTVYYTKDAATNVVSDIFNNVNPDSNTNWTAWTDPTKEVEATSIKIVKNGNWDIDSYFYTENGISVVVTPVKNAQADAYYNGFMVSVDRPEGFTPECDPEQEDCSNITFSPKLYFQSSKSLVEVYSRQISGFVFEDYNYSDMYENGEDQLENIIVELYKLNNPNYNEESDSTNPNLYVDPSKDELVSTKTTNAYGAYSFAGLDPGYYYVLFRYDGAKYTPSDKYGGLLTGVSNANQINSKAVARNLVDNEAVSDIITLSSSASSNSRYINLGLRIRKDFGVEINKYITSIVQTSNQGTKTYEYDKATKVNIDIKNMKNTKFRVTYSFDIVNTKYFPGYIGVIADLMPAGMTFDSSIEENEDWTLSDGVLYYTGLQNRLLLPGDKQYFKLVLDLDTNKGGTYLNIVAAQQPILMGDDIPIIDYSSITVEADTPGATETSEENPTDTNNENSGTQEGNGE